MLKWAKAFKDVREAVKNEPHDRRLRISIPQDNIRLVEQLILEDRRMNVWVISTELGISISIVYHSRTPSISQNNDAMGSYTVESYYACVNSSWTILSITENSIKIHSFIQ